MGLQDGRDVEMTLQNKEAAAEAPSSSAEGSTPAASQTTAQEPASSTPDVADTSASKEALADAITDADGDGDITLSDEPTIPQGRQDEGGKKS